MAATATTSKIAATDTTSAATTASGTPVVNPAVAAALFLHPEACSHSLAASTVLSLILLLVLPLVLLMLMLLLLMLQ